MITKFFNLYHKKNKEASRRVFILISVFQIIAVKRAGHIMAVAVTSGKEGRNLSSVGVRPRQFANQ